MILNRRAAIVLAAFAAGTIGCSGDASQATDDEREAPPIIATTSIWADVTSEILCGAPVGSLVPAGTDPHDFEPSLRDRETIGNAQIVIANGAELEGGLTDLLDRAPVLVEATDAVDVVDGDPHIWQDPRLVARAAAAIAEAADAAGRTTCLDSYTALLDLLDAEIDDLIAAVPPDARVMVTSHDALGYFAERYGLEVVGTVIPSTSTLAETNARDLDVLADIIDARAVPAIFTEELESASDASALAERLGVAIVPLTTDALTDDPPTDTYVGMMRSNAERIAEALTP